MSDKSYETVTAEELGKRLDEPGPDNDDPDHGFALVNVLGEEAFEKEHIPSSINIPKGNEDEFEKRFAKDKPIVVYCASPECDASPEVASELTSRGFGHVYDFEAGMSGWKKAGLPVERGT